MKNQIIRAFDWRDFTTLRRYRDQGLSLDTTQVLTRSMTPSPVSALLSSVAPATDTFTYVVASDENGSECIIGQFVHSFGSLYAQLTFLAPEDGITSNVAFTLLDHLAREAGKRGAHNLLAEIDERSRAFEVLRKTGYVIYARQRIWYLEEVPVPEKETIWKSVTSKDEMAIRTLYSKLVPALVQQAEPPPWEKLNGLVYGDDQNLLAYVHLSYGPKGILAQPFIHPDTEQVVDHLASLLRHLPNQRDRPVYLCVRSHQAWLESYLAEMGAEAGARQAVMVKRLAISQKVDFPLKLPNRGLENVQPEATTTLLLQGNGHTLIQND